ncbi:AraC family transcriptional regulator [Flindersiella endophytica]
MDEPLLQSVAARPQPALRPWVSRYLGYHLRTRPGSHRGLPSRNVTFIITLEGTVDVAGHGAFPTLAGGLHATPVRIDHDGLQHGIQAEFTPLGARALLGLPAGELAGAVVDLGALLGRRAAELADRIRTATTWTGRFAALDAMLERIAMPGSSPSPELGWAWKRLTESAGSVEIGTLAAEIGWSRQHLRTRFQREYGLAPKVAARVMRFETARSLLTDPSPPPLADVAQRCGYADQAHFNRDWLDFAGTTPSAWLSEEIPFVQDDGELCGQADRYD